MIEVEGDPTVLILDQDLGFVFWLAEIFNEVGCQVAPGLDYTQAVSLTKRFHLSVDLVVVNPALEWAQQVLSTLSARGRTPKIVVIRDEMTKSVGAIHADAILKRPTASQQTSRQEMLAQVREILGGVGPTV